MRVLVTGNRGYVGTCLVPALLDRGHDVVGLDSDLFRGCDFGPYRPPAHPQMSVDVRDVSASELDGLDAIVHLAGISNDPLGDLNPKTTYDINYRASVRLGQLAKRAGVRRFLFASSCSIYGAAGDGPLGETAAPNPVTPYGRSKMLAEHGLAQLADRDFSPTFLRAGTVFGVSPRLRADLVVNNLVGYAVTTGAVLLKSDGTAWRPLVHVTDLAQAYVEALEAPRDVVHGEAFNVGADHENHQVREIAELVEAEMPGTQVVFAPGAGPDRRSYRVDFSRISSLLPNYRPAWSLRAGIRELANRYRALKITKAEFLGSRLLRIRRVQQLIDNGSLSESLRWRRADPDTTTFLQE